MSLFMFVTGALALVSEMDTSRTKIQVVRMGVRRCVFAS